MPVSKRAPRATSPGAPPAEPRAEPAPRALSAPAPAPDARLTGRRLGLLAGATLLAPGVLGAQLLTGRPVDVGVLTAAAAALFLLVLARMAGLVRHHASALRREAALR